MIQQSTNSLDETESISKQPQHQHHISPMNQLQSPNKEEAGKKPSKIDHIKQYIFKTVENMPTPKLMWLISPIAIVIYSTAFNIASEVLYSKFTYNSYGISFFKIAVLFLDVFIFLVVIYEQFYFTNDVHFTNKWSKYTYILICKILKKILWIILLIACVFQVIVISTGRLNNPLNIDNDYMQYFEMTPNEKTTYFIINLFSLIFNGAVLTIWWSTNISSVHSLFGLINLINILIGISISQINIVHIHNSHGANRRLHNWFIITGSFMTG